jgi:hypothetical protein
MAIFTQIQLIASIQRIELQMEILPLSTVFNDEQKKDILDAYEILLTKFREALAVFILVKEATHL